MDLDLKVLNALSDDEEKIEPGDALRITEGAHAKAMMYAKLASRIAGHGMECYGYLLKEKGSLDDIVTDVLLAPEQRTNGSHVLVTGEGVAEAAAEIDENGYEILGWWHSHGTHGTFHSGTDVQNFKKILNAIAPQTMYRTEEAIFKREGDIILVDNFQIEGVNSCDELTIKKRVERDPFAYSLVVNIREEEYKEFISKTYDPETKEFTLNSPSKTPLEKVAREGDIVLDIPDMEWHIYENVTMTTPYDNEVETTHPDHEYRIVADRFVDHALDYVTKGGKFSHTIASLLEEPDIKALKEAEKGRGSKPEAPCKEISDRIVDKMAKSEFRRFRDSDTKYRKFELENKILLQFMISSYQEPHNMNALVKEYSGRARLLEEVATTTGRLTAALTRYAMDNQTDYRGLRDHKYQGYIARVLRNCASQQNMPFMDAASCTSMESNYDDIFLFKERVNIFNQLTKDLYFERLKPTKEGEKFRRFCSEFADADNPSQVIENYLEGKEQKLRWYERFIPSFLLGGAQ